ncbi:Down syndrome cell adhesion molecule-like protein Dscam2 [Anneissia japonica]|uniref:Down syndrome cell adhesion molecule-like protein Dscam2 n=1 Tax=Anneissia japonica TaxID=1529436 RepID=UPI001425A80E|nr:Down syndrome cell adhesion molecule-like protein Dscam2 [Anneissia japonica]
MEAMICKFSNVNLLILCVLCVMVHGVRFVEQPIGVTVVEGETFVLRCVVEDKGTNNIFWKTMDSDVLLSRDTEIDPYNKSSTKELGRYSIVGDPGAGEYNLQIANASREDSGRYSCLFFSSFNQYSRIATVKIMVAPDAGYPKCSFHPEGAIAGDTVRLTCRSSGGDPPARLVWVSGTVILRMYMPQNPNPVNEVSYVLKAEDLNKKFTCAATTPALVDALSCSVVPYRKKVFVLVQPVANRVMEGEYANFRCTTQKKKSGTIRWVIGSSPVDPSDSRFSITRKGKRLRILETTRKEHNNVLVLCQVLDKFGVAGNGSAILFVESWGTTPAVMTTDLATDVQVIALESNSEVSLVTTMEPVLSTNKVSTNISNSVVPFGTDESLLAHSTIKKAKESYSETVTKTPLVVTTRKAMTAQPLTSNATRMNNSVSYTTTLVKNVANELFTTVSDETSTRRQANNQDASVTPKLLVTMTTKQVTKRTESFESTRLMAKSTIASNFGILSSALGNVQTTRLTSSGVSMEMKPDDELYSTKKNVHNTKDRTDISNNIVTKGTKQNNFVSQNAIDIFINKVDFVTENITESNENKLPNDSSSKQAASNNDDLGSDEQLGTSMNVLILGLVGLVILIIIIVIVLSIIYIKRRRETSEIKAV